MSCNTKSMIYCTFQPLLDIMTIESYKFLHRKQRIIWITVQNFIVGVYHLSFMGIEYLKGSVEIVISMVRR